MMGPKPFPEKRKKREEGRQAPDPLPERRGTRKSMMKLNPFLRKERREKKGDKHRNQRREEARQAPAPEPERPGTRKSWWNRTPFRRKEKERRREQAPEPFLNPSRNQKNQDIMMEQNPFPKKRKKREEGRQAPEPQPEAG